jgi:hypothetical protein
MPILTIPRETIPDLPAVAVSITPLLAVANAGAFAVSYQEGAILIEQAAFTNVDVPAVQAAVAAAPVVTALVGSKRVIDDLPVWHRAFFLTLLDQINQLRTQPSTTFAAVTPAQAWTAVKTKIDQL